MDILSLNIFLLSGMDWDYINFDFELNAFENKMLFLAFVKA